MTVDDPAFIFERKKGFVGHGVLAFLALHIGVWIKTNNSGARPAFTERCRTIRPEQRSR
jgi:hypothetical protein